MCIIPQNGSRFFSSAAAGFDAATSPARGMLRSAPSTPLWSGFRDALRLEGRSYDITRWLERMALRSANRVVVLTEIFGRDVYCRGI
jgi:hypothetical protein